jgi:predicted RNA-binding protein with PUA domain
MSNLEEEVQELRKLVGTISNINFSYVAEGGQVKMIAWGKDYKTWNTERKLEFAEALASAMNEAAEIMQNERNILAEEVLKLNKLLEKAQEATDIMRNTNVTAITKFNAEKQDMAARIRELETMLSDAEKRAAVAEITNK